jgi:hypothetical protein
VPRCAVASLVYSSLVLSWSCVVLSCVTSNAMFIIVNEFFVSNLRKQEEQTSEETGGERRETGTGDRERQDGRTARPGDLERPFIIFVSLIKIRRPIPVL